MIFELPPGLASLGHPPHKCGGLGGKAARILKLEVLYGT